MALDSQDVSGFLQQDVRPSGVIGNSEGWYLIPYLNGEAEWHRAHQELAPTENGIVPLAVCECSNNASDVFHGPFDVPRLGDLNSAPLCRACRMTGVLSGTR